MTGIIGSGIARHEDAPSPLGPEIIASRVGQCPSLPSLNSNARDMIQLLNAGQAYTQEICSIVERDPSLAARVLKIVNSPYFGITYKVETIEQAVFYVGTEQIRHLAMATPVIEDFEKLVGEIRFAWRGLWQHSIAVAMLTREILSSLDGPTEESDYVSGLVHDVGKIVMAAAFPKHFNAVQSRLAESPEFLHVVEEELLGVNHMHLGGLYLKQRNLPTALIEAARFHTVPEEARECPHVAAAVQIANLIARKHELGSSGETRPVSLEKILSASGWTILAPSLSSEQRAAAYSNWQQFIQTIPNILSSIV
ncbi:MAG: HDOD domain-containing protein [Verrucomicrobia bacterium]|nr:HDOD domain-containing protein [Verrucomicrobiota bacterium]